jgi:hypothetical protein
VASPQCPRGRPAEGPRRDAPHEGEESRPLGRVERGQELRLDRPHALDGVRGEAASTLGRFDDPDAPVVRTRTTGHQARLDELVHDQNNSAAIDPGQGGDLQLAEGRLRGQGQDRV